MTVDANLTEVSQVLSAVLADVEAGELSAPVWLRDRLRAAQVTLDMVRPPAASGVEVMRAA
jgi:hypothetical protein